MDREEIILLAKLLSEKNKNRPDIDIPPCTKEKSDANLQRGDDLGEDDPDEAEWGSPCENEGEMWICEEYLKVLRDHYEKLEKNK